MQFFLGKFIKKNKKIFLRIHDHWKWKNVFSCFILIYVFSIPVPFCHASLTLEDVVQKMQSSYENTKDFKADFVQETSMKSAKKKIIEEGKMFFKKPRNLLWDYSKPEIKKIIINSQKAWLYLPQEKIAYTQSSSKILQSHILINFFSGAGNLKKDFIIRLATPEMTDSDGHYLLVLTPRQKNAGFSEVRMTVDQKNFSILRLSFDDVMGNATTLYFSNMAVNSNIPLNMFRFRPPAGVDIFPMN